MAMKVGIPDKQKEMKKEEEESLEMCLKLSDQSFRYVSIPGFNTLLQSLTTPSSSSSSSSSSSVTVTEHRHDYSKPPVSVDEAISNIVHNRLPVVVADEFNFKGPFTLPGFPQDSRPFSFVNSNVVGSTLYCIGGDADDIGKYCFDLIDQDRNPRPPSPPPPPPPYISEPPRPPPGNSIEDQFRSFIKSYYDHLYPPPPVHDPPEEWCDPEPNPTTTTSTWPSSSNANIIEPNPTITTFTWPTTSNANIIEPNPTTTTTSTSPTTSNGICPKPQEEWGDTEPNPTTATTTTSTSPSSSNANIVEGEGICHKPWMLDLHNPNLGWFQGERLLSPRLHPHVVSYQGKLYAFGGNDPSSLPFAEVYDPLFRTWTQLPTPPFGRLTDTRMIVLPLKGWNKLWVFDIDGTVDYTYHVVTRKWKRFTSARHIIPLFFDIKDDYNMDVVAALNHVKHMLLYWISPQHMVYAFNLSTNELFMGAIPGTDRVEGFLGFPLIMHHLQRDIFCIIGVGCPDDQPFEFAILHVTILQISTKPPPKSPSKTRKAPPKPLTVAILACLSYPLKDKDHFYISNIYMM